ncbi:MAG TPA: AarF/ABC1/UbiB kinase family protein [Phycisphaerae bacterium]|nr:AarF/ABC1/UbiB kinase family protein [Phycisphaerae bacterium]
MSLATLPKTVRTFTRLRVIAQVLSKHGFGHFVDRMQLGRYLPSLGWIRRGRPPAEEHDIDPLEAIGARLVRVCEELGPTFVKLGQAASTRPDILPSQIQAALEKLQDEVTPFPTEQARRIFHQTTGTTVDEAFREFTDQPFASGSIAQVHRAVTTDGQEVVVKIKRPGIDQTVQLDIYVLEWLADRAESLFPELRPYHPKMLVDEFAQTIRHELDFINEASATSRFYEAFKDDPHIYTPAVRWDLTGSSVLTLEFMHGIRLREALDGQAGSCDKPALARSLAECFLTQFFELGLFHADPHPGNLLIRPPAGIVLFDFGMVGRMDDELVGRLVFGIYAAVRRETEILVDILADLGAIGRSTDREALGRDLDRLLEKYNGLPLKHLNLSTIFKELIDTMRRNDVTLPRDFVAMIRSLTTGWGVVLQLDPDLNLVELIEPKLAKLLRERASGHRLLRIAGISAWHLGNIMRDAPRLIRDVMRGIGRGQFQLHLRHEDLAHLAGEFDRSSNRLAFSVLMASTIIGSSMLLSMDSDAGLLGMPLRYLGFVGYALSFLMAMWLGIAIWRSGRM